MKSYTNVASLPLVKLMRINIKSHWSKKEYKSTNLLYDYTFSLDLSPNHVIIHLCIYI